MSTRCNVVVQYIERSQFGEWLHDEAQDLIFYRHCDGNPNSVFQSLDPILQGINKGTLRIHPSQVAGWIIVAGHYEYSNKRTLKGAISDGWKCGAYEPTCSIHGDIEYLYTLKLYATEWGMCETHPEYFENHAVLHYERV